MEESNIELSGRDKENLIQTAKWGRFFAILGFIFTGLLILVGFSIAGGSIEMPGWYQYLGILYVGMSLVYLFPALYLHRFSNQLTNGIYSGDSNAISEAFANLRKLFAFLGVFTIIVLGIYFLTILAVLGGASVGSFV